MRVTSYIESETSDEGPSDERHVWFTMDNGDEYDALLNPAKNDENDVDWEVKKIESVVATKPIKHRDDDVKEEMRQKAREVVGKIEEMN